MPNNTEVEIDGPTQLRRNRALVLKALVKCSGTAGDSLSAPRVEAFIADPDNADIKEVGYTGALKLTRFYVAADKPNKADRAVLWNQLMINFDSAGTNDAGGWGPDTNVSQLQRIVDEAVSA